MANDHVDEEKVDLLRRKLIEGGEKAVTERFGEAELSSPEVRKAKDQVKRRAHIGDTLHSRVDRAVKAEEAATEHKARSERASKQAATRGAAVRAKITPERELPKSQPPKATPQRSPKAAAAVRQAAARQRDQWDNSRGR